MPKLEFTRIRGGEVFTVLGQPITPVPLVHAQFRVLGFRIDGIAMFRVSLPGVKYPNGLAQRRFFEAVVADNTMVSPLR